MCTSLEFLDSHRGEVLVELRVESGESSLSVVFQDAEVLVDAVGDCCSESWFADIHVSPGAFGSSLERVEWIELADPTPNDGRSRQEEDRAYGFRLVTQAGQVEVIFRNSSNGYYGGWVELSRVARSTSEWVRVVEDWSA